MHSPFVFDFIRNVLNNHSNYQPSPEIESLHKQLMHNKKKLLIEELGAGSRKLHSIERSVAQLTSTVVKPVKYGKMFFRLTRHHQPKNIIELGTSLGITTAYLANGAPGSTLFTVEGSKAIYDIATINFKNLGLTQITALNNNFDIALPGIIASLDSIELCFIDGNHRYQPTINYFHQILKKFVNNTILIFDDIHWSREMEQAWEEIKAHSEVQYTIDIFFLGFVFFRKEFKKKQHFIIRF